MLGSNQIHLDLTPGGRRAARGGGSGQVVVRVGLWRRLDVLWRLPFGERLVWMSLVTFRGGRLCSVRHLASFNGWPGCTTCGSRKGVVVGCYMGSHFREVVRENGGSDAVRPAITGKGGSRRCGCQCQNRRISGRGSRTVRLRLMVTRDRGHEVLPRFRLS